MTMTTPSTQPGLFDFHLPEFAPSAATGNQATTVPCIAEAPPVTVLAHPTAPSTPMATDPKETAQDAGAPQAAEDTPHKARGTRGQPSEASLQSYRRREQEKTVRERLSAAQVPATPARKPRGPRAAAAPLTLVVPPPTPQASSLTLHDGWQHFLAKPLPNDPTRTHADLKPNQLGGFRRALEDFALGVSGATDLGQVPLSALARDLQVVFADLEQGAAKARQGDVDGKRLSNLRSDLKRVRAALDDLLTLPGVAPKAGRQMRQARPKQHKVPGFLASQWPIGLRLEMEGVRRAYTDTDYAGPGHRYFAERKKRVSSNHYLWSSPNQYVKYVMEEEGLLAPRLVDLIDADRVLRFRGHYFRLKGKNGGHDHYRRICTALVHIAKYLEAIGELNCGFPPDSEHHDAPWSLIIALGKTKYREGVNNLTKGKNEELPLVSPAELLELGRVLQTLEPRTTDGRQPSTRQLFRRLFAAAFFLIGSAVPLRARNWREMQWGKNLSRDAQGHWVVHFKGVELKNGTYEGQENRIYRIVLPDWAVEALEWWMRMLEAYLGPDFQTRCSYVFPMLSTDTDDEGEYRWVEMSHKYMLEAVDHACLEVRGHRFRPHHIRHCVATHVVKGGRVQDAQQAATLLGDTLSTVIKHYFKPDEQQFLDEGYYAEMARVQRQ